MQHYPVKTYKQCIIGNFIADFYCYSARLIIEIDGSQHYTDKGQFYDDERTKILKKFGLHILRFSNKDVDGNFEGVCYIIDQTIKERMQLET